MIFYSDVKKKLQLTDTSSSMDEDSIHLSKSINFSTKFPTRLTQIHKWKNCKTLYYFLHSLSLRRFFFHHLTIQSFKLFQKKNPNFNFYVNKLKSNLIHFRSTFKKKKLLFLLRRMIEDHPSRSWIVSNLSSRTAINITFNKREFVSFATKFPEVSPIGI